VDVMKQGLVKKVVTFEKEVQSCLREVGKCKEKLKG